MILIFAKELQKLVAEKEYRLSILETVLNKHLKSVKIGTTLRQVIHIQLELAIHARFIQDLQQLMTDYVETN